jgi:hypothetical protein
LIFSHRFSLMLYVSGLSPYHICRKALMERNPALLFYPVYFFNLQPVILYKTGAQPCLSQLTAGSPAAVPFHPSAAYASLPPGCTAWLHEAQSSPFRYSCMMLWDMLGPFFWSGIVPVLCCPHVLESGLHLCLSEPGVRRESFSGWESVQMDLLTITVCF